MNPTLQSVHALPTFLEFAARVCLAHVQKSVRHRTEQKQFLDITP